MEIMELAAQLGKAIRENEVYQNFLKAKEAYDHNDDLNRKIMEYGVQQRALQVLLVFHIDHGHRGRYVGVLLLALLTADQQSGTVSKALLHINLYQLY